MPSNGLEPSRLSAQALNLLRITFSHEGKTTLCYVCHFSGNVAACQSPFWAVSLHASILVSPVCAFLRLFHRGQFLQEQTVGRIVC